MNHKRGKKKKETEDPDPRRHPTKMQVADLERERRAPAKLKRGYCKRLKGEHQYAVTNPDLYGYKAYWLTHGKFRSPFYSLWEEERCIGCQKKRIWRIQMDQKTGEELSREHC